MPILAPLLGRADVSSQTSQQWSNPSDVFSVLLILGGDVVCRALAQLAGSGITPVAFSFGWVAYAVTAVVNAVGENALMPPADCTCRVINGRSGFVRDNSSWVIGRIVRDFESWMDDGRDDGPIQTCVKGIIDAQWKASKTTEPPPRAGLCISVYRARQARPGHPGYDRAYLSGFATVFVQLGVAAIPLGLHRDWAILLVTAAGIALALTTGALPQWAKEKWACRRNASKTVVLTRGNGSQHAIVVISEGQGLDLEDLAAANSMSFQSSLTRYVTLTLALLWILLLITAAGIQQNTWFLLAVGGIGILHNVYAAGVSRSPEDFGIPLEFVTVIGHRKVMEALFELERHYPRLGKSMLPTFMPGDLRPDEVTRWEEYDTLAARLDSRPQEPEDGA